MRALAALVLLSACATAPPPAPAGPRCIEVRRARRSIGYFKEGVPTPLLTAVADDAPSLAEARSGERYGVALGATLISAIPTQSLAIAAGAGLGLSGHDDDATALLGVGLGNVVLTGAISLGLLALEGRHEARAVAIYNRHALDTRRCVGAPGHTSRWPYE
jgi:hypothetical protein